MPRQTRKTRKQPPISFRTAGLGLAAFAGGVATLAVGAVALGRRWAAGEGGATPQPLRTAAADGPAPSYAQVRDPAPVAAEGHAAPDLAADAAPGERAPEAFRPDMDAPMTAAEREALRPATGPSPTLVDAGTSLPAGS